MTNWPQYKIGAEKAQAEKNWSYAVQLWRDALDETGSWPPTDERRIYTLEQLCECLWHLQKFTEAIKHCQQLVLASKQLMGDDHLNTACVMGNLAMLYHAEGNYEQAVPLYQHAIAIKSKHLGSDHPDVMQLQGVLADISSKLGGVPQAVTTRMWSKTGKYVAMPAGPQAPEKPVEAKPAASQAITDPQEKWKQLSSEAEHLAAEGQLAKAQELWKQAIPVAKQINDRNYTLCITLETLAALLERQEKYREAVPYAMQALETAKAVVGNNHPSVARTLDNLARLSYYCCEYHDSEEHAKECLGVNEAMYGSEHPAVATSLNNLAMLYHVQKKYDEAEPLYKRSLSIRSKALGSEHPDTARVLREYANLLKSTHREEEAEHLDKCAKGVITGSWKVLLVADDEALTDSEFANEECSFCGTTLGGLDRCPACNTEAPHLSAQSVG